MPGLSAKSLALAWLATMASDIDRRPKGVVGCVCMILCLVQAKEICSPKRRQTLDSDSRKCDSLSCNTIREASGTETFRGPFSFAVHLMFESSRIFLRTRYNAPHAHPGDNATNF